MFDSCWEISDFFPSKPASPTDRISRLRVLFLLLENPLERTPKNGTSTIFEGRATKSPVAP